MDKGTDAKSWATSSVYGYVYMVGAMTFIVVYQTGVDNKNEAWYRRVIPAPHLASGIMAILIFATRDFSGGNQKWTLANFRDAFIPSGTAVAAGVVIVGGFTLYDHFYLKSKGKQIMLVYSDLGAWRQV